MHAWMDKCEHTLERPHMHTCEHTEILSYKHMEIHFNTHMNALTSTRFPVETLASEWVDFRVIQNENASTLTSYLLEVDFLQTFLSHE